MLTIEPTIVQPIINYYVTNVYKCTHMGLSENIVCLNPMVNDQFPY